MKKHIIFNDIILITPDIFDDKRGFFSEIYNKKSFEKLGINIDFVQVLYHLYKHLKQLQHLYHLPNQA